MILTEKAKLDIFQNIARGQYSCEVVYHELDDLMEDLLGIKEFTGDKYSLTTQQVQIILNTLAKLEEMIIKKEQEGITETEDKWREIVEHAEKERDKAYTKGRNEEREKTKKLLEYCRKMQADYQQKSIEEKESVSSKSFYLGCSAGYSDLCVLLDEELKEV